MTSEYDGLELTLSLLRLWHLFQELVPAAALDLMESLGNLGRCDVPRTAFEAGIPGGSM